MWSRTRTPQAAATCLQKAWPLVPTPKGAAWPESPRYPVLWARAGIKAALPTHQCWGRGGETDLWRSADSIRSSKLRDPGRRPLKHCVRVGLDHPNRLACGRDEDVKARAAV